MAAELTEDVPMVVSWGTRVVCLYRISGQVFATANTCSHGSASLSDGEIIGYEIECPFHEGRFDVRTGVATRAPCRLPIETFNAEERDGMVWLRTKSEAHSGDMATEPPKAS